MKVLIINGSPRKNGNTALAISELIKILKEENVEVILYQIEGASISGCLGCNYCYEHEGCVFHDVIDDLSKSFKAADGLVIASPVYYASANGTLISLLDRLFASSRFDKSFKVGASIAVARRGGCSATFDELNKYFTISNMPIVSSQYWNSVHGLAKGEAMFDLEGLQTMRTLARNMVFLMRCIELGKEKYGLPEKEKRVSTNFINK